MTDPKTGRPQLGELGPQPESVLTREKLRALLSPASSAAGYPVLVLAPGPDQISHLAALLKDRGVAVTPIGNCFAALDRFRRHPCTGFVAFAASLPPDVGWYLARLRGVNPEARICLIRDGANTPLPPEVPAFGPELSAEDLDRLVACLGLASQPGLGKGVPADALGTGRAGPVLPARREVESVDAPTVGGPRIPDPLLAVQFLLEARLAGRPLEDGLLRWAGEDPAVRGWVDHRDRGGELHLRASADAGEDRAGMLTALLGRIAALGGSIAEPTALGPFGVFPRGEADDGWVALWHREAAAAEQMVRGLHRLGPLLASIQGGTPVPYDRERFVSLLGSRMRAAERHSGRLGLLLFAPDVDRAVTLLSKMLRALLRGGDWVEPIGSRVYVILEEPERQVFSALGDRLRELPGIDRLRVVALPWTPLDADAARFLEKAEELLQSGGQGEGIPGLTR